MVNAADHDNPLPGFLLSILVTDGPNTGLQTRGITDDKGQLIFSYIGSQLGTDRVSLDIPSEVFVEVGVSLVNWTGGPDLVIQLFVPPVIDGGPGKSIPVTETTGNIGNAHAGPSVTRYFLSTNPIPDPIQDQPLGERPVPPLAAGEASQASGITLHLPDNLPAGTYRLGACADAGGTVAELNERVLPKDVRIVPYLDRSWLVDATVHTIGKTLLEGMFVVSLVLFLFLGSPRAAAIVALTIPLSLLIAFIFMHHFDIPANLLSLGAIDFGIIVDGSIFVMENILRRREERVGTTLTGPDVIESALEMTRPVFFGMLVIITGFMPLLAFQRIERKLFSPMAFAVDLALVGALLVTLMLIPGLAFWAYQKPRPVVTASSTTIAFSGISAASETPSASEVILPVAGEGG